MAKICGIYKILSPSGKVYIGQSINIEKRFRMYKNFNKSNESQIKLMRSFRKHGVKNHVFTIIESCLFDQLNKRERYWQDKYDVLDRNKGLNLILTSTDILPTKVSEETKEKLRKSFKGRKTLPFTKEHKQKLSESHMGHIHPEERKKKMSKTHVLRRAKHHKARIILCLETGIFYDTLRDAAEVSQYSYSAIRAMLNGENKNKTNFIKI